MYGDAATKENDWGFGWHPLRRPLAHADDDRHERGSRARHVRHGAEPRRRRPECRYQRIALGKLDWLVVKDNFETETAAFWYEGAEVMDGSIRTEDIQTEIFFFPVAKSRRWMAPSPTPSA